MAGPDSIRSPAKSRGKFYIYEHVRRSDGRVFYVGKGSGSRLRVTQHRNPHWVAVSRKHGWEARVAFRTDDEDLAFLAEEELIRKRRNDGSPLTNMTDGGEGMSGYVFSEESIRKRVSKTKGKKNPATSLALKGVPKSAEHRRNLSLAKLGFRHSEESRNKMSRQRKGQVSSMLGRRHTEEAKAKISAAVSGERNPFFGKTHSPEVISRVSEFNTGRKMSDATRRKMSRSRTGPGNHRFGVSLSDDQIRRQRETLMSRPLLVCPHCGKSANDGNAKRWHFNNCRSIK